MTSMPAGAGWLGWLEGSALGIAMRQWLWLYPIVEIVHIAGFVILVGAAVMFDLRLLGVSRHLPVAGMARHLLPWARASLALVIPTGVMMFTAHATEMAESPVFRLKLLLVAAGALNAAAFHVGVFKTVAAWNSHTAAPARAKLSAVLSLAIWTGVLSCGRLLAYF
jgi:hypothetical protein